MGLRSGAGKCFLKVPIRVFKLNGMKSHLYIIYMIFIAMLFGVVHFALADQETVIENNVSVTSSSGGNVAEGGTIVQGEAQADIFIETIVNGETVEFVEESVSGAGDVEIHKTSVYESGNTDVEIGVNAQTANPAELDGQASSVGEKESHSVLQKENVNMEVIKNSEYNEEETITEDDQRSGFIAFLSNLFGYVFSIFKT